MSTTERLRTIYSDHPLVSDIVIALTLMGVSLAEINWSPSSPQGIRVGLIALGTLPFVARRRSSALAAMVMLTAAAGLEARGGVPVATIVAALAVFYMIGLDYPQQLADRFRALTTIPFLVVVLGGFVFWTGELSSVLLSFVLIPGVWILSETVAARRANQRELEERNRLLEEARSDQIRLAIEQERTAIARELHDIVAHSVSVIVVQAAAAQRVGEAEPDRIVDALESIEATGRQALAEMRLVLGVMRGDRSLEPQPGLRTLEQLADQVRAAGVPVTLIVEGEQQVLPGPVELSAYRIIQEALTNTVKHGGQNVAAEVRTRYGPDRLMIDVVDNGRGAPNGTRRGHGLIGIRERVALFGGVVEIGNVNGEGFRVHAELPVRGRS